MHHLLEHNKNKIYLLWEQTVKNIFWSQTTPWI